MKGKELRRKTLSAPYLTILPIRCQQGAFRVILEDTVSTEEGTGIVHSAPAFGEVDFYACQREGIDLVCPVDNNGHFTSEIPEYQGQFVKDADKEIIQRLKAEGSVIHHGHLAPPLSILLAIRYSA